MSGKRRRRGGGWGGERKGRRKSGQGRKEMARTKKKKKKKKRKRTRKRTTMAKKKKNKKVEKKGEREARRKATRKRERMATYLTQRADRLVVGGTKIRAVPLDDAGDPDGPCALVHFHLVLAKALRRHVQALTGRRKQRGSGGRASRGEQDRQRERKINNTLVNVLGRVHLDGRARLGATHQRKVDAVVQLTDKGQPGVRLGELLAEGVRGLLVAPQDAVLHVVEGEDVPSHVVADVLEETQALQHSRGRPHLDKAEEVKK